MPGVLIISRDWQSRALLRAQLIEEGCDVRSFVSAEDARMALSRPEDEGRKSKVKNQKLEIKSGGRFSPDLVIADISAVSDRAEVAQLVALVRRLPAVPLWVIASRGKEGEEWIEMLQGPRLEKVMLKPIDGGALIEQIKRRVG